MNITSLYAPVTIAASSIVGEHCTLGYPKEARLRAEQHLQGSAVRGEPVTVGERCLLANHVVLYEGVRIGDDCVIEDRVRIGYHSMVGCGAHTSTEIHHCDVIPRCLGLARMGKSTLHRIERGQREPTLSEIVALASALEIAPSTLIRLPILAPANGYTDAATRAAQVRKTGTS